MKLPDLKVMVNIMPILRKWFGWKSTYRPGGCVCLVNLFISLLIIKGIFFIQGISATKVEKVAEIV